MKNALVLTSGGVDSSTALALAVEKYGRARVIALSISYGQKHDKELQAAKAVAAHYGVEQLFLDLGLIFRYSDCALLKHPAKKFQKKATPISSLKQMANRQSPHMCHSATDSFSQRPQASR